MCGTSGRVELTSRDHPALVWWACAGWAVQLQGREGRGEAGTKGKNIVVHTPVRKRGPPPHPLPSFAAPPPVPPNPHAPCLITRMRRSTPWMPVRLRGHPAWHRLELAPPGAQRSGQRSIITAWSLSCSWGRLAAWRLRTRQQTGRPCTALSHAGASLTYPQQAGTIRKNAYIVINNRPCKVRAWPAVRLLECQGRGCNRRRCAMGGAEQSNGAGPAGWLSAGCGRGHLEDRQARPRQVPLRGR